MLHIIIVTAAATAEMVLPYHQLPNTDANEMVLVQDDRLASMDVFVSSPIVLQPASMKGI